MTDSPTYQDLENRIKELERENSSLRLKELEIRKTKELYLKIFDDFPALIWRSGLDKKCDYFNKTWLDFTGRTLEQEFGNGWAEGVHPEDFDMCLQIYITAFDKREPFEMEYRLKNKLGEYRWIRDFGRPFYGLDNDFIGYIGSCYDITESKKADKFQIQENRDNSFLTTFALQLANLSDQDIIKDIALPQIKEYTGAAYAQFATYDSKQKALKVKHIETDDTAMNIIINVAGKRIFETVAYVDEEKYNEIITQKIGVVNTLTDLSFGAISPMIDKVVRKVTGFHYFYGIAQINAGKLYGVTVLAFKKNDTLPSEYLLRMYSGLVALSLKRKQAELELQESETKLRVLNADKDRFMQIIAHDLRNPFNALLGFSKLLLKNIHKYDIEKIENQLQIILQTTQKTGALLDNLLLWSNAQSGKLVIEPQKFEFSQICQQIIDDVKPHADSKEIAIHCFESEKTIVYADLNMFKAILRNLISNAIKFTKRNGHIDVYAEVGSQDITIVVSDNGVGIEEKKIPKLWDFAQPMSTVGTAAEKGTGFGLLLCKELVEKHDGTIWVESIAGKGSDFKFTMTNGNLS